jgi:dolichyl-phosphate beta-glucosyltransferase
MSGLALSVVIPAFDEAARLPGALDQVRAFFDARGGSYEVLVVDDGSVDGTAEIGRAHGARVLANDGNRGKGFSVRRGMLEAQGALRLMTDADLSTPIEDFAKLAGAIQSGSDIAIGSRALDPAAVEVRQGAFRETAGRAFNLLVRLLLLPGIHDTQCGFKLFTAAAALQSFTPATQDGFAFDVEVLVAARRRALKIAEVAVRWRNDTATRVGMGSGARAFTDLLTIRTNLRRGTYDPSS